MSETGSRGVEQGNLDIYRFDIKNYSFFNGAFTPAKTNSKLRNKSTQSINAAGTWKNFGDFKTLLLILNYF